ncbi:hypothetical protein [Piscinibacter sp.]|uniref:hypothetical protein n=1 Tax=Piscinibacter sp. TaxID=1903157 RepID=UPI002D1753EC|nr:hypothetical protein [Albitalea sp.]HUG24073.1 hypothetical protein [Albitalea sp.]
MIPRASDIVLLTQPSQLSQLRVAAWRRARDVGDYEIVNERFAASTRKEWQLELRRRVTACGCGWATLGMGVGLVACAAWTGVSGNEWFSRETAWVAVASAAGGLALGKTAGLFKATRRLQATVAKIQAQWPTDPSPG